MSKDSYIRKIFRDIGKAINNFINEYIDIGDLFEDLHVPDTHSHFSVHVKLNNDTFEVDLD